MIILLVPWHDLLRKSVPYSLPFKNGFGIRLNISGEKNSVKKNLSSIWTAWRAICSKKMSSIRMAWAIRLKKLLSVQMVWVIHSKKKLSTVWATEATVKFRK